MAGKSKSAKYYQSHPEARKVKARKDTEINARPEQVKKRVESNKANRDAKKAGISTRGDYDHAVGKFVPAKVNRGRKGEGGRKKR